MKQYITYEKALKHCENNGIDMSPNAIKIIDAINRNEGHCPCCAIRCEENRCPCDNHLDDINKKGQCHCKLFVKRK